MTNNLSVEIKTELLQTELQMWENHAYTMTIRHKVGKRLNDDNMIKGAEQELERAMKAIDVIYDEMNAINKPPMVESKSTANAKSYEVKV